MKVRVVDLHRSGLGWEFIPCGTQDLDAARVTGEASETRLPTLAELLASIKQDENQNPAAESEKSLPVLPSGTAAPAAAPHSEDPSKLQEAPAQPLKEATPPTQPLGPINNGLPADFEVEIDAPAAVPSLPSSAAAAGSPFGKEPSNEFDYFAATQVSPPAEDHSIAWAAGMAPLQQGHVPQPILFRPAGQAQPPLGLPARPPLPPQAAPAAPLAAPPAAASIPQPAPVVSLLDRPHGRYRPPRGPGNYVTLEQIKQQEKQEPEAPEVIAARKARAEALQAELQAIWNGTDEGLGLPGGAAAYGGASGSGGGGGFITAAAIPAPVVPAAIPAATAPAAVPAAATIPAAAVDGVTGASREPSNLHTSFEGSVEMLSPTAAQQLSDLEAAAMKSSAMHKRNNNKRGREEAENGGGVAGAAEGVSEGVAKDVPSSPEAKQQRREHGGEEMEVKHQGGMEIEKEAKSPAQAVPPPAPDAPALAAADPTAFPCFTTGLGKVVYISPTKLDAAKRKMLAVDDEYLKETAAASGSGGGSGGHAGGGSGAGASTSGAAAGSSAGADAPPDPNALPSFTTGLGKVVVISPTKLAAAKRKMLALDDEYVKEQAAGSVSAAAAGCALPAPVASSPASASGSGSGSGPQPQDTPTLRREVLNMQQPRQAAASSPASASKVTPAGRSAGPSRFALQAQGQGAASTMSTVPPATGTTSTVGPIPVSAAVRRGARGKFSTPRPVAPKSRLAVPQKTSNLSTGTPKERVGHTSISGSATPLHDLSSSKLKKAISAATAPVDSAEPVAPAAAASWVSSLPLDSTQAGNYMFVCSDGARVGPGDMRARLIIAGAKAEYATEEWVRNHYRWVVWKLARTELNAGATAAGLILSEAIAEDELRLRYEREFNRGHRPLIKAIMHQDEPAAALCVLMVASVKDTGKGGSGSAAPIAAGQAAGQQVSPKPPVMLELTDGWYWVMAQCDEPLSLRVDQGKIGQGTKLRICGAELGAGANPGDPLVAARSVAMRITANGTHPVPFSTKLGRQNHRSTYTPLHSIHPAGGIVPQTLVVVLRRYPSLAWSTLASGVATFQTPRARAITDRTLQAVIAEAEAAAEAQVHAAELARCKEWLTGAGKPGGMTQTDRFYATVVTSGGEDFASSLTMRDREALEKYTEMRQRELAEERHKALQARLSAEAPAAASAKSQDTGALLVGEVLHTGSAAGKEGKPPARALIRIWDLGEDLSSIKEGEVFAITGLEPSKIPPPTMGRLHTASLHLESRKRARWRRIAPTISQLSESLQAQSMTRAATSLGSMSSFGETALAAGAVPQAAVFDFTGVVIKAGPVYLAPDYSAHYQWIFLADSTTTAKSSVTNTSGGGKFPVPALAAAAGTSIEIEGSKEGGDGDGAGDTPQLAAAANDSIPDNKEPWLLAVKLQGPEQAINWLSEKEDSGAVVTFKDLELGGADETSRLWQAVGGMHTAVSVMNHRAVRGAIGAEEASAAWVEDNPELLDSLRVRVAALMQ